MAHVITPLEKSANKMSTIMTSDDVEKIGQAFDDVRGEVMQRAGDLKAQAESALKKADAYIKENPLYFVGGAAVIGLAAGYMLACATRK